MGSINYPTFAHQAYPLSLTCEICSLIFDTSSDKNSHFLNHFEQEMCLKCDQNLLRIGENLYVLHGTITCIPIQIKNESIEAMTGPDVHDEEIFVEQIQSRCSERIGECISSLHEKTEITEETYGTNAPMEPCSLITESNIKHETETVMEILRSKTVADDSLVRNIVKKKSRTRRKNESQVDDSFECNECYRTIPLAEFRSHMAKHVTSSSGTIEIMNKNVANGLSCNRCGSRNLSKYTFIRHHRKPHFKCSVCNEMFCKVGQLKIHYQIDQTDSDPYQSIDISSRTTIREMYDSKFKRKYKCLYEGCGEMLSTSSRKFHMASKHKVFNHKCNICKKVFLLESKFRIHMENHKMNKKNKQMYSCSICGVSGVTKQSLKRSHLSRNIECSVCQNLFCKEINLTKHHVEVHLNGKRPPRKSELEKRVKKFKCVVEGCTELLSTNNQQSHMLSKHKVSPVQCDMCKKMFSSKREVAVHIQRVHLPSIYKNVQCDLCEKRFLSKSTLENHKKISHIKARNFMCSDCGATFVQKTQLEVHISKHTGEKRYECTFEGCTKRFRTQTGRIEHLRSHTGEKPYECPIDNCDRRFAYNVDLKRHKYSAHGIFTKRFNCTICSDVFPENMLLKKHMDRKHEIQTQ